MFGFINLDGDVIFSPEFDEIFLFQEGFASVKKNSKYYYINRDWELIDPGNYSRCYTFYSGLAKVFDHSGKLGYIDTTFELKIPCDYDVNSSMFSGNYAVVTKEGIRQVINKEGQCVLSNIPDLIWVAEELGLVCRGGKYGFIDLKGQIVVPCEWDDATTFKEGFATVMKNNLYSFIDRSGRQIVPLQYDFIAPFTEGVAFFKRGNKFGFINSQGVEIIAPAYKEVNSFSGGLAPVCLKNKWGFIDKNSNVVVDFYFDYAKPFKDGYANVEYQNGWALVDTLGNIKTYPKYPRIGEYSEGLVYFY